MHFDGIKWFWSFECWFGSGIKWLVKVVEIKWYALLIELSDFGVLNVDLVVELSDWWKWLKLSDMHYW